MILSVLRACACGFSGPARSGDRAATRGPARGTRDRLSRRPRPLLVTLSTAAALWPLIADAHPEPHPIPGNPAAISWFQPGELSDWDIRFVPFGDEPETIYAAQPGTQTGCWTDDLTALLEATESGAAMAYVRSRANGLASEWSDARLVRVPEPSTAAGTISGTLGLAWLARRRRSAGATARPDQSTSWEPRRSGPRTIEP